MRAWLEKTWDKQVGFDEYLPGTPHSRRSLLDDFPYHIWGRSSMPNNDEKRNNATEVENRFREQDATRRRQYPSCFEEACAYGNLQAVVLMWSQGTVDIPTRRAVYEGSDASPLMWASLKGHLPIVRFLVHQGAPLEATNTLGHTALQWAINAGQADVARYLLDHGADPSHRDRQGFDAAFSAVQNDRLALLLMLTEDASREGHLLQTSDDGIVFYQPTPEQRAEAASKTNPRTHRPYYLLNPTMRDVEGHTLMHWAAYRNSPATCQYLLDHWGYAVDAKDQHGRTPLVWAAREGFAEVMELLLSRGADRSCPDHDEWTALQYAHTRHHPEAVYVLQAYPIAPVGSPVTKSGAEGGVLGEVDNDAVNTALLGGHSHHPTPAAAEHGGRYVCVRDRRAYGTFQMLRTHAVFAVMAAVGPLYLALTYIIMHIMPPVVSYFPLSLYFFKNIWWTMLTPRPTQSSRTGPPLSTIRQMGIAASIAEAVRGTWLFRMRDPANLFVWGSFMLLQVVAWNWLGLPPLFAPASGGGGATTAAGLWPTHPSPPPPVDYVGLSFFRFLTLQQSPLAEFRADIADVPAARRTNSSELRRLEAASQAYVVQSESIVRWVLMVLLLAIVLCAAACKLLSTRSTMRSSEEGTLRTSPLWRIVAARQYRWLHPRFVFQERHMQLPLRAFYCHERDVVVRGYDGYSNLLDCPVGQSNHVLFVLTLTFFTVYEGFMLMWGYQKMSSLLKCPARVPWYTDAFFAFQRTEAMEAALQSRALLTSTTAAAAATDNAVTSAPLSVVLAVAAPVMNLAWLSNAMDILLHGLPCRQYERLNGMTRDYLRADAAAKANGATPSRLARYVRRTLFLIQYYLWPTRATALGLWVLHYSFLSAVGMGCVAVRQWMGVWSGATRLELANPLAQGSDGELVALFPGDAQQAQRFTPVDPEVERYYAAVCPDKARPVDRVPDQGGRCIYADGHGVVNVLSFLLGRRGPRWRHAMAVSSHNAPVKRPMLM